MAVIKEKGKDCKKVGFFCRLMGVMQYWLMGIGLTKTFFFFIFLTSGYDDDFFTLLLFIQNW